MMIPSLTNHQHHSLCGRYLDGATCWAVHPLQVGRLDLVPVWTGAPVSVTPAFHRAVEQGALTLEEEEWTTCYTTSGIWGR